MCLQTILNRLDYKKYNSCKNIDLVVTDFLKNLLNMFETVCVNCLKALFKDMSLRETDVKDQSFFSQLIDFY